MVNSRHMKDEKKIPDLPTAEQLHTELKRIQYNQDFEKTLWNTISSLIVIAAAALIVSMIFVPVLRVTGTSMAPTLSNDELILCIKNSNFQNGDIVAFYYNNKILLKRVIGVAGDKIDISEDGIVSRNGEQLQEPYVNELDAGECDIDLPYQVPDNRIFVMGDHRAVSIDSRSSAVGCIAEEYVIGKVFFRLWPWEKIGTV